MRFCDIECGCVAMSRCDLQSWGHASRTSPLIPRVKMPALQRILLKLEARDCCRFRSQRNQGALCRIRAQPGFVPLLFEEPIQVFLQRAHSQDRDIHLCDSLWPFNIRNAFFGSHSLHFAGRDFGRNKCRLDVTRFVTICIACLHQI